MDHQTHQKEPDQTSAQGIAIVGLAGRFPWGAVRSTISGAT